MHLTSRCFLIVRDWVRAPDPLGLLSAHCTLVFKSDRFLALRCYGVRLMSHADVIWVTLLTGPNTLDAIPFSLFRGH